VGDLPTILGFWEGPRSGTNHFRLEVGFIRYSPFRLFFKDHSGPVCPFQCQALERWLELLPSGDCEAHSAGKRSFVSYAKRHFLQLDASSRLLDATAFNRCILTLSLSSWHPGDFRFHRFGRRFHRAGPWHTFLVLFHVSAAGAPPQLFSFSVMPYAVWMGVMRFPRFGLPTLHYFTRGSSRLIGSTGTPGEKKR
jgi:hypothetical protein